VKIKKSQLKELIRQAIVEDIMDKEIKNPKTGNKIKVRTALQLPDEHPANKKAKDMVAKTPTDDKSKKKKGFLSKLSKLNPFSKKDDEPKEKPDSLRPDKPSFLGGDTKVGEKAEQTHNRVGEFIDDNEGNIPEEYVDKLKDLQKRAKDIGLSIFNNDGRVPVGTTNKIKELDAEAQEMMDDIEQKAMDGEFDEPIKESKQRRYTVKEVRMWMKKLEENRYKKVYNSDARRVAWMVNNEGRTLDEMPISMKKKWTKAQYGRERYLATEFLKSKSEQMNESIFDAHALMNKKIKNAKTGNMITIRSAVQLPDGHPTKKKARKILNKAFHGEGKLTSEQKLREQIREIIKEQLNEKTFGSQAQYDAYRKKHTLKPGTKVKVAGKTITVRGKGKMSKKAKSLGDRMADKLNKRMADLEKKRKQGKIKEAITGSDRKILFILVRDIVRNLKSKIKNFDVNNKSHLNRVGSSILAIIRAMTYSPDNVNYKNFKKYFPKNFNSKLIQKKLKQFHSQNDKVQVTLVTQAIKNELGAGVNEEKLTEQKFKKVILPNDMKTKVKVSKIIKKMKLKIDKDYDVKALKARGGDQELLLLPKHYNKFIELAMQNKLNPRG
jgi:hypothetical protein